MSEESVRQALKLVKDDLLKRRNVTAVGVGFKTVGGVRTDEVAIIVSVAHKLPLSSLKPEDIIPQRLGDVRTDVTKTGELKSLEFTGRERPAKPGLSIGHVAITAGTFGFVAYKNRKQVIVSNNHVLANSNDAELGDLILQPGPHDGGENSKDILARLSQFVEIGFTDAPAQCPIGDFFVRQANRILKSMGSSVRLRAVVEAAGDNLVDAAIAEPVRPEDIVADIINIGVPEGAIDPALGMKVQKSGRTTEYTTDEIIQVDVTANVSYGSGKTAVFTDQFMMGPMSAGGDSGSAVLNQDRDLVGLLFAGSEDVTICNRIHNVLELLGLDLF